MKEDYFNEIIKEIIDKKLSKDKISILKHKLCSKYQLKTVPTDIEILLHARPCDFKHLKNLQTKPVRSISGVAPVAVMTKPIGCRHGKCVFCPGGVGSVFGDTPQSYTGYEPSTMRGMRNKYDPYLTVMNRLEQFAVLGHNFDKVELILMGGTFPSFPKKYKDEVVTYSLKAMNDFGMFFNSNGLDIIKFKRFFELPGDVHDKERTKRIHNRLLGFKGNSTIETEQRRNEKAKVRCIALCIETRPDYCREKDVKEMLRFGCTRVEIGIQSVYDDVLKKVKRGHTTKDTIESIRVLKDLGFKVAAHYMPGLPLTNEKRDLEGMRMLFSNPDYKPDMIKIYPCMVAKGTKLYDEWKKGRYKPLTTEKAAKLIAAFKSSIPSYCRVQRIQRDIPSNRIEAGVDITNLRQYIHNNYTVKCNCIRCREIGRVLNGNKNIKIGDIKIKVKHYKASRGDEFFISAEENNVLFGYCRLRFPSRSLSKEIEEGSALIRELHVYSMSVQIGKTSKGSFQHQGLGKRLLKTAERICKRYRKRKIVVISGIGAREYFRKFKYKKEGFYMTKRL